MMKKNELESAMEFYLGQKYMVRLRPLTEDEGGGWLAEIPDWPGCISDGETPDEALRNLEDAKRAWLSLMLEQRRNIPLPSAANDDYSGRVTLRMPKTLHRDLARTAEREETSLNQLLVNLLSFAYGALYRKAQTRSCETIVIYDDMPRKKDLWMRSLPDSIKSKLGEIMQPRAGFGNTSERVELLFRRMAQNQIMK